MKGIQMSSMTDRLVDKDEPQFNPGVPAEKIEIVLALNWYSQNKEKEHSHKYLKQYCKEHNIQVTDDQISAQVATLGFVSRMLSRNAILDERSMQWFHTRMAQMQSYKPVPVQPKPKPKPVEKVEKKQDDTRPVEKKPRKKKSLSPEAQVRHVKYLEKDTEIGVKSIDPIKIVGASTLWTYHVPSRMLTQYVAKNDSGLMMNRCSIENYSEEKSQTKKLRKPELILPKVVTLSSNALKGLLNELTTKDAKITGRINSQTIIMRATI